jgi:hypothetical protein
MSYKVGLASASASNSVREFLSRAKLQTFEKSGYVLERTLLSHLAFIVRVAEAWHEEKYGNWEHERLVNLGGTRYP